MFSSFNCEKLKTHLTITATRARNLKEKKTELSKKRRSEIANFIKEKRIEFARITVEEIIREDYLVEVLEFLEIYCSEVPQTLEKAIASVLWLSPRLMENLTELSVIESQFKIKYGKEFYNECKANLKDKVDAKIIQKMQIISPPSHLIENYMLEIAKIYSIPYTPDPKFLEPPTIEGNLLEGLDLNKIGFNSPYGPPPLPESRNTDLFDTNSISGIVKKSLDADNNMDECKVDLKDEKKPDSLPPPYKPSAPSFPGLPSSDINLPDPSDAEKEKNTAKKNKNDDKSEDLNFDDLAQRFEALKKLK